MAMGHRMFATILLIVSPLSIALPTAAQAQSLTPATSSLLAGAPEAFLASCRSDLEETKKRIAALKATRATRDTVATLQAFDTAILVGSDTAARSGLAEQVHPAKPFRDAAQVCEQEAGQLLTDISLDKDMYDVLASLDGSNLDPAASYFLRTTLRD